MTEEYNSDKSEESDSENAGYAEYDEIDESETSESSDDGGDKMIMKDAGRDSDTEQIRWGIFKWIKSLKQEKYFF